MQIPFFLAAGLSFLAAILIGVFLPESHPEKNRTTGARKFQGPQLGLMWQAILGPLGFLFILAFLHNFALTNFEGIYAYYAEYRYGYDAKTIGLILTIVGLVSAVVQGVLTGVATRKWGDVAVTKVSLFASIFGFLCMLLARDLFTVIFTTSLFILSNSMLRPSVSSLISKRAQSGQGQAMGLNNAFMSLGRVIGPLWAGKALDMNINFPFITGSVIMVIGFIASMFFLQNDGGAIKIVDGQRVE
jgi:DHA1 family multidrug resistance protein-like MFS transporter